MESTKPVVFLIDDEEDLLFLVESRLKRSEFEVKTFLTAEAFRESFSEFSVSSHSKAFVITDYRLSDTTGYEILKELSNKSNIIGAALQTGFFLDEEPVPQIRFPFRIFEKPVDFEELIEFIVECSGKSLTNTAS